MINVSFCGVRFLKIAFESEETAEYYIVLSFFYQRVNYQLIQAERLLKQELVYGTLIKISLGGENTFFVGIVNTCSFIRHASI